MEGGAKGIKLQLSGRLGGAEMAALQKAELAHWEPIIKASGFKPE